MAAEAGNRAPDGGWRRGQAGSRDPRRAEAEPRRSWSEIPEGAGAPGSGREVSRSESRSAGNCLLPLPPRRGPGTLRRRHPDRRGSSDRWTARLGPRGASGHPRPSRRCTGGREGPAAPGAAAPAPQAPGPKRTPEVWQGRRRQGHAGTAERTPGSPDAASGVSGSRETLAGTPALRGGERGTEFPWNRPGGCPLRGPWSQRRCALAARRAHGRGEHRPPSTGRSLLTGAPGPQPRAAELWLSPRSRHAALPAAGLLGPCESRRGRPPFLPPRSLRSPGGSPSRVAQGEEAGETKRPAAAGGGKDPGPGTRCPGPGGGEGAFRPLGFFLPRWLPETAL